MINRSKPALGGKRIPVRLGQYHNMQRRICPICKKAISQKYARSLLIGDNLRYYHDDCYDVLVERLERFWDKLTGTQEDFESWLIEDGESQLGPEQTE